MLYYLCQQTGSPRVWGGMEQEADERAEGRRGGSGAGVPGLPLRAVESEVNLNAGSVGDVTWGRGRRERRARCRHLGVARLSHFPCPVSIEQERGRPGSAKQGTFHLQPRADANPDRIHLGVPVGRGGGQFHCFSGFPRYLRLSAGTKSEAATSGVEVAGVVLPGMGCGYGGVCVWQTPVRVRAGSR